MTAEITPEQIDDYIKGRADYPPVPRSARRCDRRRNTRAARQATPADRQRDVTSRLRRPVVDGCQPRQPTFRQWGGPTLSQPDTAELVTALNALVEKLDAAVDAGTWTPGVARAVAVAESIDPVAYHRVKTAMGFTVWQHQPCHAIKASRYLDEIPPETCAGCKRTEPATWLPLYTQPSCPPPLRQQLEGQAP